MKDKKLPGVATPSGTTLTATKAIILYQDGSGTTHNNVSPVHATQHDIVNGTIAPSSTTLTLEGLQSLFKPLVQANRPRKIEAIALIQPNTLYSGNGVLCWWRPAGPAPAFLRRHAFANDDASEHCDGIDGRTALVPMPALLFAVSGISNQRGGMSLAVCALATNERPNAGAKVFRTPFLNTYDDTGVCMGNVELPKAGTPDFCERLEECFFCSWATGTNGVAPKTLYEHGLNALWTHLITGSLTQFPTDSLPPLRMGVAELTLSEFVSARLTRSGAQYGE